MARQFQTEFAHQRQHLFEESLLQLMRIKDYSSITVKDICAQADIPRRTFYHYFDSKEELLDLVIENTMLPGFLTAMFEFDSGYGAMKQSFVRFFRFFNQENRERLRLLLDNGHQSRLIAYTTQWAIAENIRMPQQNEFTPKHIRIAQIIGSASFFSLLFYWCRNDYRESPEEMAECIVWFLTKPLYKTQ